MLQALVLALLFIQGPKSVSTAGTISGQVVTAEGMPAAGVRVGAQDVGQGSSAESTLISLAETDDAGHYRLVDVPPGRYYIVAGAVMRPTYFPGVADRTFAQAKTVNAGEKLESVDFPLAAPLAPLTTSDRRAQIRQSPCATSTVVSPGASSLVIAADRAGNVFFAEAYSSVVRRISRDGKVTLVAGTGTAGHTGDGGPATAATIERINALAADSDGNLYIAEASFSLYNRVPALQGGGRPAGPSTVLVSAASPRIRKVTPLGIISTIAGNGTTGADGDGGQATSASLCPTTSMAADGQGNLYIGADPGSTYRDFMVRKVDAAGKITTLKEATIYRPDPAPNGILQGVLRVHVAAAPDGNVYVVGDGRIQKITPAGIVSTVATVNRMDNDAGVATDGAGNVILADSGGLPGQSGTVQMMTPSGAIATIAGDGGNDNNKEGVPALSSSVRPPMQSGYQLGSTVAADGEGNVYLAETSPNRRIRKITPSGIISTVMTVAAANVKIAGLVTSSVPPDSSLALSFSGEKVPVKPTVNLYLVGKEDHSLRTVPATTSMNSPDDGHFEFTGRMRPGDYELFAELPDIHGWGIGAPSPKSYGRTSVTVPEDLANVAFKSSGVPDEAPQHILLQANLRVHPGIDLHGRIVIDGRAGTLVGLQVELHPDAEAAMIDTYRGIASYHPAIAIDGTFRFPALPEARYDIVVLSPAQARLEIKAILLDGKSLVDSRLDIGEIQLGILEIQLETNAAR